MSGNYQLQKQDHDSSLLQRVGAELYNAGARAYQSGLRLLTGILTAGLTLGPAVGATAQEAKVSGEVPYGWGNTIEDARQLSLEGGNLTATDRYDLEACVDELEGTNYAALGTHKMNELTSTGVDDRELSSPTYCVDLTA